MKRSIALLLALAMMLMMISGAISEQENVVEPDLGVDFGVDVDDSLAGGDDELVTAEESTDLNSEEVPASDVPAEEIPAEEIPAEEVEEAPAEEIPAEEVEEAPAEVIPAEETPVAEAVAYRAGIVLSADGADALPLYDAPGGTCIASVSRGQMIEIGTVCGCWAMIRWSGTVGYVDSNCIALYNSEAAPEEKIRSIVITTNIEGMTQVREGTVVALTATLIGFEDDVYTVQWQYSTDGGATANDIGGANSLVYAYRLSAANFNYMYRIVVTIDDTQTNVAE